MRKMAFVVFDIDNSITDRLNLDLITDISGLGFKLKLSTIEGDIEDIITKVVQNKQEIKFNIHFINYAYEKSAALEQWLQKFSTSDKRMALEYFDGRQRRYTEGKVTNLTKTEKDEYNRLMRETTFKPITPFFSNIENLIKIKVSSVGKSYPFKYPYCYGKSMVENNEINNPYISDVPVTVKITGSIYEPTILLIDENGNSYNQVKFPGKTLNEGEYIIINSAEGKIYYFNGSTIEDFTAETSPSHDTFLRAKNGISTISINLASTDTGELTGSWRQYSL